MQSISQIIHVPTSRYPRYLVIEHYDNSPRQPFVNISGSANMPETSSTRSSVPIRVDTWSALPVSAIQSGVSLGSNLVGTEKGSAPRRKLLLVLGPGLYKCLDDEAVTDLRKTVRSTDCVSAIIGDTYRDISEQDIMKAKRALDQTCEGPTTTIITAHGQADDGQHAMVLNPRVPRTATDSLLRNLGRFGDSTSREPEHDIVFLSCEAGVALDGKDHLPQGSQLCALVPDGCATENAIIKPTIDDQGLKLTLIDNVFRRLTSSLRQMSAISSIKERNSLFSARRIWEDYLLYDHNSIWCPPLVTPRRPPVIHVQIMRDRMSERWSEADRVRLHDLFDGRLGADTVQRMIERSILLPSPFDPMDDAYGAAIVFSTTLADQQGEDPATSDLLQMPDVA